MLNITNNLIFFKTAYTESTKKVEMCLNDLPVGDKQTMQIANVLNIRLEI